MLPSASPTTPVLLFIWQELDATKRAEVNPPYDLASKEVYNMVTGINNGISVCCRTMRMIGAIPRPKPLVTTMLLELHYDYFILCESW